MKHLFGKTIIVERLRPRYVLPPDVPPPAGMTRESFAKWSADTCGYQEPTVADGAVYTTPGGLFMNHRTYLKLEAEVQRRQR